MLFAAFKSTGKDHYDNLLANVFAVIYQPFLLSILNEQSFKALVQTRYPSQA